MRFNKAFFDRAKSRTFIGDNAAHGRVTVEPYWSIKKTAPVYGDSIRGPYRYYTDKNPIEYEVPSIKSITWNRSTTQDLASCSITIYNTWHNLNTEKQELATQLGKKGYFWPKRGQGDSSVTWNQSPSKGAYKRDGTWDETFSWQNILVEDALIRTYEGYGGKALDDEGNFVSIDSAIDNDKLLITGVWIVNSVTAGSDGLLVLNCTDIGRILIDQIAYPPVIPNEAYPLEYYPPGKSAFDSPWGPKLRKKGTLVSRDRDGNEVSSSPASRGEVWVRSLDWSGSSDTSINTLHPAAHAVDGDWDTYALSEAYSTMTGGQPYFEFLPGGTANVGAGIDSLQIKPWAGGYTVYISIAEDPNPKDSNNETVWRGTESIPGGGLPYVKKVELPLYFPDGKEGFLDIDLDPIEAGSRTIEFGYGTEETPPKSNTYYAKKVRLTFENLHYSAIANASGHHYRAGIRDLKFYRDGADVNEFDASFEDLPWTFAMDKHPVRGYWIADSDGNVYGFGDAADYDTRGKFPAFNLEGDYTNRIIDMAAHPSGEGFWILDWMGNVYNTPNSPAQHYGDSPVPNPHVGWGQPGKLQARGMAVTHTGDGYWVLYSNGIVRGFGDATPKYTTVPGTSLATFMDAYLKANYPNFYTPYDLVYKGTAIASHPKKMGYWVTDASGQVWAYGEAKQYGQLKNRVHKKGMAGQFKLLETEWATSIESTESGDGYWIAFGSGRVAAFGDATKIGKTPYIFEQLNGGYDDNVIFDDTGYVIDPLFFRAILWGLTRDPDGNGFWVLRANGDVKGYEADLWGKPGYTGLTGLRWYDGNFNGDWASIVKEVLNWAGFLDYHSDITSDEAPAVLGLIESTGIVTDSELPASRFDKSTIIDIIKELAEVVGYEFRITEDGRPLFASPNWWRAGNFDEDGLPIFVAYDEDGEPFRVDESYSLNEPELPSPAIITAGTTLNAGEFRTCNGAQLIMQTDGNLVLYGGPTEVGRYYPNAGAIWSTKTFGNPGAYAQFQSDGNLVVRNSGGQAIWTARTYMYPGAQLRLQADRNLVIYWPDPSNGNTLKSVWSTQTSVDTRIGPQRFIPVIHESQDMLNYSVTLSSTDKKSEIIVGTEIPDRRFPDRTSYIRFIPPQSLETLPGGVSAMRGIERTGLWASDIFRNERERRLMAELISLHGWFASRAGNASITANPALTIGDQIRLVEQNTSETFIHLIRSISSNLDNDSGVYKMDLTTVWMGNADDWVISAKPKDAVDYAYTVISDELNSWQIKTNRGLEGGTGGNDLELITASAEFSKSVQEVQSVNEMIVLGDSLSYLDSTLNGLTGDRWTDLLKDAGSVKTILNGAYQGFTTADLLNPAVRKVNPKSTDVLVLFVGANEQGSSSGISSTQYGQNLLTLLEQYPATKQLVVFPWPWTQYGPNLGPAPSVTTYNAYKAAAQSAAAQKGALFLDMGEIVEGVTGNTGSAGWADYRVDMIHPSALGHELIAESISSRLYINYGDSVQWQFEGSFTTTGRIDKLYITPTVMLNLGFSIFMELYDGSSLIGSYSINYPNQPIYIGDLGTSGQQKTYTFKVRGTPDKIGFAKLQLAFTGVNSIDQTVEDSILFTRTASDLDNEQQEGVQIPTTSTTPPPVVPGLGSGIMFGYNANGLSQLQSNIAAGMGTPKVWRDFEGASFTATSLWSPGIPINVSFKPDISKPVSNWAPQMEDLLRTHGNGAGRITYVTVWHEPENDLGDPFMGSAANFRRALNETTRICRKLTAENLGGKFYSVPIMMAYTLNPSSGRNINDWLNPSLVDYDIVGWDAYPNSQNVIPAIDITVPMSQTTHAQNITTCMNYSISVGKPWAIPEMGTARYDSEMQAAGVVSYTNTQRATYMQEFADFVIGLSNRPVYVCYYTYGRDNVLESPELAMINTIVTSY